MLLAVDADEDLKRDDKMFKEFWIQKFGADTKISHEDWVKEFGSESPYFKVADTDNSGTMSLEEFTDALYTCKILNMVEEFRKELFSLEEFD